MVSEKLFQSPLKTSEEIIESSESL